MHEVDNGCVITHIVQLPMFYGSLNLGGMGDWSSDGCSVVGTRGLTVTCTCNHLTNFGVVAVSLMCTVILH